MGTATRGVHQAPDFSEACPSAFEGRKEDHTSSPDLRTLIVEQVLATAQILSFSLIANKTRLLSNAAGPLATTGLEGRWPASCLVFLLSCCVMLVSLTLNALRTAHAIAVMTVGTSHYRYLWVLNTSCYKNCLKHRGRRLHYCITAHVLKPDFLLQLQSGQVSLKNLVSNLTGFSIGICSPLCPF